MSAAVTLPLPLPRNLVLKGLACGFFAALAWGAYLALSRAGVAGGLTGVDIAFLRFSAAGLITLPWLLKDRFGPIRRIGLGRSIALATTAGPLFILVGAGGYAFAPLAHGAALQPSTVTLVSTAVAAFALGERPTPMALFGIATIIVGIAVIAGPGLLTGGHLAPLGDAMFITAGLFWSAFTLLLRRWRVDPLSATAVVSGLSALVTVPAYLLFADTSRLAAQPWQTLALQLTVQGVVTGVLATLAFATSVKTLGAARAAIFPALVPTAAILMGIPVTGEIPTTLQLAGLALVTTGLIAALGLIGGKPRA